MRRRPGIGGLQKAAAARVWLLIRFDILMANLFVYKVVCAFVTYWLIFSLLNSIHQNQDQYRLLGENVAKLRTDMMKEQLATFRSQLEEFARKHKVGFIEIYIFAPLHRRGLVIWIPWTKAFAFGCRMTFVKILPLELNSTKCVLRLVWIL